MASQDVINLQATRSSMITLLQTETNLQIANGPKPDYSLDGESVQWEEWRDGMVKRIDDLTELIRKLSCPWMVRTKGRT